MHCVHWPHGHRPLIHCRMYGCSVCSVLAQRLGPTVEQVRLRQAPLAPLLCAVFAALGECRCSGRRGRPASQTKRGASDQVWPGIGSHPGGERLAPWVSALWPYAVPGRQSRINSLLILALSQPAERGRRSAAETIYVKARRLRKHTSRESPRGGVEAEGGRASPAPRPPPAAPPAMPQR